MEYVSPADAFSSSLEQALLLREQQARQAQQDQLALQREARLTRIADEEREQARIALEEKRAEFAATQKEKRKASFEKSVGTMVPGDIPSPELVAQAKEFGLTHLFPEAHPEVQESMTGVAAMPVGVEGAPQPTRTGTVVDTAQQGGLRFIGSPAQRQEEQQKAEVLKLIQEMPEGPQRSAIETAVRMGVKPTVDMFKPAGSDSTPVARVDPRRRVIQRLVDGQWVDVNGDVPKGTHFLQEPAPPSTAAADARAASARERAYNTAVTQLNKAALPYEDQLKNLENAAEVLNERSPSGDAHVAPMILKALVAGQGSGFRMTKSEIDQVQNARSKWQSMEAAFRKWAADPKDALFFDDEQRADFLRLVDTVKAATMRHLEPVIAARNDIDLLDDPRDIQKRVTQLHNDKLKPKEDVKDKAPMSAADLIKKYGAGAK